MKWLLLPVFAVILMGAACQSMPSDVTGAGFVLETPNAASRQQMIANDRTFAEQVIINRAACAASPGCKK